MTVGYGRAAVCHEMTNRSLGGDVYEERLDVGVGILGLAGCGSGDTQTADTATVAAATVRAASPGPVPSLVAEKALSGAVYGWGVLPGARRVRAGNVKLRFHNLDQIEHELVVIRTARKASALGSGARVSEAGSIGEIGELKLNGSGVVTVRLTPGHYALICNIAGHYTNGMHADIDVVT